MVAHPDGRHSIAMQLSTWQWAVALAASLAAVTLFRLIALRFNATDLFFDEAQYWSWSLTPAFGYYSKPPLIAWVIRLATDSCGLSEFCIRLPAPLMHAVTAAAIFTAATRLYDARVGFWSALVFATLPGVSLSAGLISTDVPLLMFWAIGLASLVALFDTKSWFPALTLGLALGLGLNAKYAMAYFALCLGIYLAMTPDKRFILRDARLWVALGLGVALIVPNIAWNASNSFSTFQHTADNAKWAGRLGNPGKAAEFFLAQFGVFGPILFSGLLVVTWRAWRQGASNADRLLLAFSLPVLAIVTVQAFLSRAHANWAAVTYVAATMLVVATLIRDLSWRWLATSMWLHLGVALVIALGTATAGRIAIPGIADPFARTLGWADVAKATRGAITAARTAGTPIAAVITDDRAISAELLYYMRDEPTPLYAWRTGKPQNHFELTRPYVKGAPEPVLLVSERRDAGDITRQFARVVELGRAEVAAGRGPNRTLTFYRLSGFSGQ